jgi:hypothetical protein
VNRRFVAAGIAVCCVALAGESIAPLGTYTPVERRHWAFQARKTVVPPAFEAPSDSAWIANPIDAFVLERLKKDGLKASPPADRVTLIRRVSYDLTGLPPSPAEVSAFVSDKSGDAYKNLVERLLRSPQYGERWGQHWLDVVRFAETEGFEYDTHLNGAWRYRDYVVRAFQNDKPFDRFVTEQIAGDELAPQEDETLVAAGFLRLGPVRRNAGNQEVASSRNEVMTEMANVVSGSLLGVTLGCARCHDHKFDPFRQSDYYRLQAYFSGVFENNIPKAAPEEVAAWKTQTEATKAEIKKLTTEAKAIQDPTARAALMTRIEQIEDTLPEPLPALYTVAVKPAERTPIHLLGRGDFRNKGDRVGMRPPGVLLPDKEPELPESDPHPRMDLAKWVTNPNNPLTARVMANRIWQFHFGRGIVGTPNDFGRMGERPTHPELLDWLANEFVSGGWSVQRMHRLILMSNTYQQSSALPSDQTYRKLAMDKDPDNKLLWRANRQRLEAEEIRDSILAVSGRLNPAMGGPSIMVPINPELVGALYKPQQWKVAKDTREHERRSVYLLHKRNLRLPFLEVFDQPDALVSCPRREASTHAPQSLELLNGSFTNQQAERLAERLEREAGKDPRKQVDLAFRLTTGHPPAPEQLRESLRFLKSGSKKEFALAMFNLNAFLYVN